MDILSSKQTEILSFLIDFQNERGYAPSVREICDAVHLSSTSSVHNHLSRLEEKGYIKRDSARPRSVEILKRPSSNIPAPTSKAKTERSFVPTDPKRTPEIVAVPILGRVRAGEPVLAVQNIEDYYPVPAAYTQNSDCFMLRVQGESMIEAGILENDLILVKSQRTANDRDIVVALLGDSVTVKTFYKEKNFIRLQPENRRMNPILVKDCQILGKVIGLVRMMNR
ncbi:MAG: transcriptional repressor LexA [Firmicutes bacterium]|nr:transcriptional repressor LexA [Bacillota bacterium]